MPPVLVHPCFQRLPASDDFLGTPVLSTVSSPLLDVLVVQGLYMFLHASLKWPLKHRIQDNTKRASTLFFVSFLMRCRSAHAGSE